MTLLSKELEGQMEGVTQLPKQYRYCTLDFLGKGSFSSPSDQDIFFSRWTKKPCPTVESAYVGTVLSRVEEVLREGEERRMEDVKEIGEKALGKAAKTLVEKAVQVG